MHFLLITLNYFPEATGVAPFNTGLCEHLVTKGHQVTAVTPFPHYPQWRIYEGYRGSLYGRESINGVDVRRVMHYVPSQPGKLIPRLLYFASFPINALPLLPMVPRFDGVFCVSPSPFVPTVAWLASRLRNVPTVLKLTDLPLDAALSLGMMQEGSLPARAGRRLQDFNYRRMSAISVLCPAFKERLVSRGVPEGRIHVVPDWADTALVRPLEKDNDFRRLHTRDSTEFVALYSGNMGAKQGLSTVIEAARLTTELPDLDWLLIGSGEDRRALENQAAKHNLKSLRLLPVQPATVYPSALAAADALLLIQKRSVIDVVIPSKLLTYMAAGRPIVGSVHPESTAAYYIRESNCGVLVEPENPSALVEAIMELRDNPAYAAQLGARGRAYVEQYFSKTVVLDKYERLFREVFPSFW